MFFREDTPVFRELADCMAKHLRRDVEMTRMNGATDARHFADAGVPVAIIGIPGAEPHGSDEHIDPVGMQAYEDMLVDFASGAAEASA